MLQKSDGCKVFHSHFATPGDSFTKYAPGQVFSLQVLGSLSVFRVVPFAGSSGKSFGLPGLVPADGFRFRPEGRVPFGTARKEPKGGLGAQARLNFGTEGVPRTQGLPPKNPRFTGEQNRCIVLTTGVLLLTPSATQGGPRPFADLSCRTSAPPMGACIWCSSLRACASNGAHAEVHHDSRRVAWAAGTQA